MPARALAALLLDAHPSSSALALAEALLGPARLVPREAIASGAAIASDGLLVAVDADSDETDEALARLAVRAWVGPLPPEAEREISQALLARLSAPPASGFCRAV